MKKAKPLQKVLGFHLGCPLLRSFFFLSKENESDLSLSVIFILYIKVKLQHEVLGACLFTRQAQTKETNQNNKFATRK